MKIFYIQIIILTLLSFNGFSQEIFDDQQKFYLINSGKSKVKVFVNGKLSSIWHIDSLARTLIVHTLEPAVINPVAPKYDDKLSISYLNKYFFNSQGNIDSILKAEFGLLLIDDNPPKMDTVADTTLIINSYQFPEKWVMNKKIYSIKNGLKRQFRADYYGYDSQNKLILLIQDEGRVQFYYSYNDKGQIEKETVLGVTILYEYNNIGQMVSRISEKHKIKYEYNANQLLSRQTISRENMMTTTFDYEYNTDKLPTRKIVSGENVETTIYVYE
jgi:YD repeat-containing protein